MNRLRRLTASCALLLVLAACGGGGLGSGGTGIDPGGVGSGGTGFAMGAIVSSADGVMVNGTRYDVSQASLQLEDATSLQPGMTVRVVGQVSADRSQGTATVVISAADLRGPLAALDTANGRFSVLGITVSVDSETVYGGVAGLAGLANGDAVIVYGLPGAQGTLRATRVERSADASVSVVSGVLQELDPVGRTFRVGAATVAYGVAAVQVNLANGMVVRVRGASAQGVLVAAQVQAWNELPQAETHNVTLAGLVADFSSQASFTLAGVPVQAGAAVVTGGTLGNGVRVQATGTLTGGVLVASEIRVSPAATGGQNGNSGGTDNGNSGGSNNGGSGTDNGNAGGNSGSGNSGNGNGNSGSGSGSGNGNSGSDNSGNGNGNGGSGNAGNGGSGNSGNGNSGNGNGNSGNSGNGNSGNGNGGSGNSGNGNSGNGNGNGNSGNSGNGNSGNGNGGNSGNGNSGNGNSGNPQVPDAAVNTPGAEQA